MAPLKYRVRYLSSAMTAETQEEVFTLGDLFEARGYDVATLGTDVNKPCIDMDSYTALSLVNKWNREAEDFETYFLEENPAWL